jgi:photosystem II stability/assembly factor-like uncharacterized protein
MRLLVAIAFTFSISFLTNSLNISCYAQELKWRAVTNAPSDLGRFEDCYFINANTGWIINIAGHVTKTTDGGRNWVRQFTVNAAFRSITFADENTGWIGCLDTNTLFQTTNGGLNWFKTYAPGTSKICGMYAVNSNVIYGCGRYSGDPHVIKTTNGGLNWIDINMSAYSSVLIDCYFFSPDSGFVAGGKPAHPQSKSLILFTSDGGATWVERHLGTETSVWCWKLSFPFA